MSRISRVISDLPKHKHPCVLQPAPSAVWVCGSCVGCRRCTSVAAPLDVSRVIPGQCLCGRAATHRQAVALEEVKLPPLCNHISGQCEHAGV